MRGMVTLGLALFALLALLAGCGDSSRALPLLQRLDQMKGRFATVTGRIDRLSRDAEDVQTAMNRESASAAQRGAVRLRRDAKALVAEAESTSNQISALEQRHPTRIVRHYLTLLVSELRGQRQEGNGLTIVAQIIERDPLLTIDIDAQRVRRTDRIARDGARRALVMVRWASAWRQGHERWFRYVPVLPGRGNAQIAMERKER